MNLVVPLTGTIRQSSTEVFVDPDKDNQLRARSSAQCQHVRSVATTRLRVRAGNVGPVVLGEVRETLALLLDPQRFVTVGQPRLPISPPWSFLSSWCGPVSMLLLKSKGSRSWGSWLGEGGADAEEDCADLLGRSVSEGFSSFVQVDAVLEAGEESLDGGPVG